MLPFFKPKKGFMIAGGGLDTAGGGGGGGGGVNYSQTEFATRDKWVDGKTIYGIVYFERDEYHGFNNPFAENVETLISSYGGVIIDTGADVGGVVTTCSVEPSDHKIHASLNASSSWNIVSKYVIAFYTKITD